MKKAYKIVAILTMAIIGVIVIVFSTIYHDIKTTAHEIYIPVIAELPASREEEIDIEIGEPFAALILGVDERQGDRGRSDTMIVLTVNPSLETTKLLSIPRDSYTEIIGKNVQDKINHAYAFGGIEMSVKTVEHLLDIPIDYVAKINMESFVELIDIVGDIPVENKLDFEYEGQHFQKGPLQLDGESALKYVRMRYDDPEGDFGRQNRQKEIIQGVMKNSLHVNTVLNYKSILKTLENHVETNVKLDEMLVIRKNYSNSLKNIEQHYLKNGTGKKMNGIYYYLLNDTELELLQGTLKKHLEID
ncbi:LytR family transcriptional regulator [Solibacillus sp. R5-41]|uniref:LCP family glycopolymer transferase n=1 Tax=Solibacillus sp. R5-41 TaxID=2048654 RepID=UPI000C124A75|nr:LCP family protein [Solibacillus sp. R5-41]ATP39422.1 LytR family transcriptional regulator [Solibacillus sp. R5-41]